MALTLVLLGLAACPFPGRAAASPADSAATAPPDPATPAAATPAAPARPPLLTRRDLVAGVLLTGLLMVTVPNDAWITSQSDQTHVPGEQDLANAVQPFGNAAVVVPALAAAWCVERIRGRPESAAAIGRIAIGVGAAGAGTLAVKEVVGRPRPYQSPGDSDDAFPFSGHASFPSGHAAIAFALATGIHRESSWRWTPWIVYPLATLVAWSRVHDHEHWTSDVVAGAALGTWSANKVEDVLQPRPARSAHLRLELEPCDGEPALALTLGR
ncbi:MAG TPA: phosphatase PAP2 family protein [Candidatus Eisenbacteria bacterium]